MNEPEILGRLDGGPSPHGISYYRKLHECPKKVRLNEEYAELQAEDEEPQEEPAPRKNAKGEPKLIMSHVGILGHALFEQRWKQQLGAEVALDIRKMTPEYREAIRMYNSFNREYGSLQDYLGMHITEAEKRMGEEPDIAAAIQADLGGPLTGRLDAAGDLFDSGMCARNTSQYLLPGRWIVDYKFGKAHKKGDAIEYPQSIQGAAYCYLDKYYHPESPAQGVLFVRIIGHKQMLRGESYKVYVYHRRPDEDARLRAMVRMGLAAKRNHEKTGNGNPLSCVNSQFGDECFFKKQKICPGY